MNVDKSHFPSAFPTSTQQQSQHLRQPLQLGSEWLVPKTVSADVPFTAGESERRVETGW